MEKQICAWTRETQDGSLALTGDPQVLRSGSVLIIRDNEPVRLNVGTPMQHKGKWYARVLADIKREAGGSWWPPNWVLNPHLPTKEPAANLRPSLSIVDRKKA